MIMEIPTKKERRKSRSVSVPESIIERMREHPDVNWSEVAADAFERVLEQIERRKK